MAKWFAVFLILALLPLGAWSQGTPSAAPSTSTIKSSSGVVQFSLDQIPGVSKPTVSVNLEGPMIRIAAGAAAEAAPPIRELLDQIELVRVQVYDEIKADATAVLTTASKKVEELKQQGWTSVVSVPEKNESVDVLTRTSKDSILGLVVLVAESNEVVFVNLAGEIDPEMLGGMIGKFKEGILKGDFDFEEMLFQDEGDDDDDDDDDDDNQVKVEKHKMKDKDKDNDKDDDKDDDKPKDTECQTQPQAESAPQQ